ncbi:MAG TPA: tetratricopeptide repeat protein [Verrucomicrobiae bacterium]|jgi:TolA-binding protein|nr:tetratricopeptide repeat protein [Verrucomicrobiae bacterium]
MEAQTTDSSDFVFKLLGWAHANRKALIGGAVFLAVVGTAAGLYDWKQGENEADANAKLLAIPIAQDLRVHPVNNALGDLAKEFPSTPAGEYAQALAAEELFVNGKYAEAEHAFSDFLTAHPGSALSAQASLGVASSLEAQNKTAEATQQYQRVIQANPTDLSVVEPAKLTLGRLAEEQNRFDLAFMQYRELAQSPNPNDLWAGEARERLQLILGKHPELMKQISAPSITGSPTATVPPKATAAPTLSAAPASGASGSKSSPTLLQIPPQGSTKH